MARSFFSQQITQITQKLNSCSSCYPLAKQKDNLFHQVIKQKKSV